MKDVKCKWVVVALVVALASRMKTVVNGYVFPFTPIDARRPYLCGDCQESFTEDKSVKCRLFGTIDVVNGQRQYYTCSTCRSNETLCGSDARYFISSYARNSSSEPCSNNDSE